MAAIKGRNVLLKYYNGSAYVACGGVRELDLSIANEPVPISNADDSGIRKLLENAGETAYTIKLSGVYLEDAASLAVMTAAATNAHMNFQFVLGAKTYTGSYMIANFNPKATYNSAVEYSFTLENAGAITIS